MNSILCAPYTIPSISRAQAVSSAESLAGMLVAFSDVDTVQKEVDGNDKIR